MELIDVCCCIIWLNRLKTINYQRMFLLKVNDLRKKRNLFINWALNLLKENIAFIELKSTKLLCSTPKVVW